MLSFSSYTHFPPIPTPPQFLATSNLFLISVILSFQKNYINGIIQYITFWDCFFFFFSYQHIVLWRFIQVVVCINSLVLFIGGLVWRYHSLSYHSPAEGHLGCFQFLAIMNKLLYTFVYRFLCELKFFGFLKIRFVYLFIGFVLAVPHSMACGILVP